MYFDKPYNRQEFLRIFQTKICPNFIKEEKALQVNRRTAYFVDNGIYKIGSVQLDKEIVVLEIEQKSSKDPRITLTKDAFKILSDYGIDNAIILFHSKDNTSYRLSLLTVSYVDWNNKKTSSYKRYSYILGPTEKTKTPEKQLLHPVKDYEDLVSRFDVEVVRKDFFEKYLELYVRLYKDIKKDNDFTDLLLSQKVDIVSFTKNLLGKIVFLYFIQQKGWLGLGHKEKEYGKGHKNFMRVMRDNFKNSGESMSTEKTGYFYNDYLERLFFAGLNSDRRDNDDRFPNLQMKVPYLNGGLFKEDYQGREGYVTKISNDIFSNVDTKGDDADGILDIFDRYNFTVDEDSLYDSDIAVDPEMLGRIFEKMISISSENIDEVVELYNDKGKKKLDFGKELNKKLGAFYTPREIVHYMTKESLIAYLINNITGDKQQNEGLIRDLFELKEQFLLHPDDLKKVGLAENTFENLSAIIEQIDEALKKVKILDPAVGSGAFPMGLLHEISSIRYYMYGYFHDIFGDKLLEYKNEKKLSLYKIKREIILNNIYGVDIDPGAIDIARLRFWLSLVVDEEQPEPLPNFEFKFVCANTLIPLEEEAKEKDLFAQWDEPKLETLKRYKRDYYNANTNKEKKELKERIKEYTKLDTTLFSEPTPRAKQMAEFGTNFDNSKHSHSFFDPSLMMSEWRGFDIVIGNPPYISYYSRQSQLGSQKKELLNTINYYDFCNKSKDRRLNIIMFFIEKGKKLLSKNSVLSYIIDASFLEKPYRSVRKYLQKSQNTIIFSNKLSGFENVTSDQILLTILNDQKSLIKNNILDFGCMKSLEICEINSENFLGDTVKLSISTIAEKILKQSTGFLYQYCNVISTGVQIGIGGTRSYLGKDIESLFYGDIFKEGWCKNISLKADDFYKYSGIRFKNYINIDENLAYEINKSVPKCNIAVTKSQPFIGFEKIIVRQSSNEIVANIGDIDEISEYSGFMLIPNINSRYILGLLNSKLMTYYAHKNNIILSGVKKQPQIRLAGLKQLPIKFSVNSEKIIIDLVEQIMALKKESDEVDITILEEQINHIVYELYGLTDEEIKVVEESVK